MKQIFFISVLCLLSVMGVWAQEASDYHPFIEEGKVWTVSFKYPDTTIYCSFGNDTIIDGHACKEFLCSRLNLFTGKGGNRRVWMYEEDRRVWYFWEGEETFKLLYDFGAELYSEFTASRMGYQEVVCTVDYIGTDRALGGLRYFGLHDETSHLTDDFIEWIRKLDFFPIWNGTVYRWYEGIGTLLCPIMNCMSGLVGPECYLIKVEVGDKVLFDRGKWSTAIRDVNTLNSKRFTLNNIFDLSGRRVSVPSVLPKGVYIRDGKKVLV